MRFEFDWDPAKAASNWTKHRISFEEAMTVFRDPLTISILDDAKGAYEEHWVTIGQASQGRLLLVVHTHVDIDDGSAAIRIISARRPTKRETRQYQRGTSE